MENKLLYSKKLLALLIVFCLFSVSFFPQNSESSKRSELPFGYGGVNLGMSFDDTKGALMKNREFGYNGDRDVSLLPGENRMLIETDAARHHVLSFLDRCWFQFSDDKLEVITINLNQERMDHYSVFTALCQKYGNPDTLSPQKSVWKNDDVTMSLERPLTLKYVASGSGSGLGRAAPLSGTEATRESFLGGL